MTQFQRTFIGFSVLVGAGWLLLHWLCRPRQRRQGVVISHRGGGIFAPENTAAAVRLGGQLGADFIEVDLQQTADGQLVLFHDKRLERVTNGQGSIGAKTWDEVRQLDAGASFSAEFAGEPIASLPEILTLMQGQTATLLIEVKQPTAYPNIAQNLLHTLRQTTMLTRVVVISFDHRWLKSLGQLAPQLRTVPIWLTPFGRPPIGGAIDIFWPALLLDPTLVWRSRRRGSQVWVWMVNRVWLMRLLRWLGADGLTTDRPDWARQVINQERYAD